MVRGALRSWFDPQAFFNLVHAVFEVSGAQRSDVEVYTTQLPDLVRSSIYLSRAAHDRLRAAKQNTERRYGIVMLRCYAMLQCSKSSWLHVTANGMLELTK